MINTIFIDYSNNNMSNLFSGENYYELIDYEFENSDFFMLVYVNYYGKGYSAEMKKIKCALKPYLVKSRSNPSWPGTPITFCPDTRYKICFYKNNISAKGVLKTVDKLCDWTSPLLPQDLAFFRGNNCCFCSTGHERYAEFIQPTKADIEFLEKNGIATRYDIKSRNEKLYKNYEESL